VLRGGTLYSRKGVNVPDLALRTEIFEKKDRDDMAFALRMNVDYLALSFIRNADDIKLARKLAGKSSVKLIAKIERHEALTAIDEIIAETDAIMIARGDLGIETPIWQLPKRQKEIIEKARNAMKPVIVATQMLESMTKNAIPTRAEVSDVANAVYDSTDTVMLSAETASGSHPVEAVTMMRHIIEETEKNIVGPLSSVKGKSEVDYSVAQSACFIANEINADVIAAGTVTGHTPRVLAHFRPQKPILAIVDNERVANELSLSYGVKPTVISGVRNIEQMETKMLSHVKKVHDVKKGGKIVFLCGDRLGIAGKTNNISILTI
jgi:pyruvate kinase